LFETFHAYIASYIEMNSNYFQVKSQDSDTVP